MSDTCRNGHVRTPESTYIYPAREGRKPRITCRTCRDGEPLDRPSQEERVAAIAVREVAKLLPKKLNAFGELRFLGLCRGIALERFPLRMAWLMAQLEPGQVADIRLASDLLSRGVAVFDMHDGDPNRIRARIATTEQHQERK